MKTLVIIDDEVFFRKSLINFLEKQNLYNIAGKLITDRPESGLLKMLNPILPLWIYPCRL